MRNVNVRGGRNVVRNVRRPRNVIVNQACPPVVTRVYNPRIYSDFSCRRRFRPRFRCAVPFLSLGFFFARPYSTYNYANVGPLNQPYFYGDDSNYQPPPATDSNLVGEAVEENSLATAPVNTNTNVQSELGVEQLMLTSVSEYVVSRSIKDQFRMTDAAFNGETWNLELTQAPAVYEIGDGLYSVVAGFEGTLGKSPVPSNVNVEFFVAGNDQGFEVRDAWITSANGIPRNKLYQSPVHPEVQTWQPSQTCPFTGQPMVAIPVEPDGSQHG